MSWDKRYYVTVAAYLKKIGTNDDGEDTVETIRGLIAEASRHLELYTNRRFDWRVETQDYTARALALKGDLLSSTRVLLKDDCQSLIAVSNAGEAINLSELTLSGDPGIPYKKDLRWESAWQSGTIAVKAIWGWGGGFRKTVLSLAEDVAADAETINLSDITGLEYGMLLRLDDEYIAIDDEALPLVATAVHVERAVNGTTAASHASGTVLYGFVPDTMVQKVTRRLARRFSALDDNPLYASATVGDVQIPFDPSSWPPDLVKDVSLMEKRLNWIGAVDDNSR